MSLHFRLLSSVARHLSITIIAFMVVGAFALVTINVSFLNPIARALQDFSMTDMYYQALQSTATPDTSRAITIVDMTELYERRSIAETIEQIQAERPKVLGVDIVFEGLKEDLQGDMMIETVAQTYDNSVYSYRLLDYDGQQQQFTNEVHSFFTDSVLVNEGYTNMQRQLYGGIKRELSLSRKSCGRQKPSFVANIVNQYAGRDIVTVDNDDVQINFSPVYFPRLRYDSVAAHPELIEDHIVLYGAMSDESDIHYTPVGKMAGVELLAYAIHTLLTQQEVRKVPSVLLVLLSFLLVFVTQMLQDIYEKRIGLLKSPLLVSFLSSSLALGVVTFIWMVLLMWGAFILFSISGISLNLGWALSAMAFVDAARSFYDTCLKSLKSKLL